MPRTHIGRSVDQLHIANKVCGGCLISLNTVDTESSV